MISAALIAINATFFSKSKTDTDLKQSADSQPSSSRTAVTVSSQAYPGVAIEHASAAPALDHKEQTTLSRIIGYGSMLPHCGNANKIIMTLHEMISTEDLKKSAIQNRFLAKSLELYIKTQGFPIGDADSALCHQHEYELCQLLNQMAEMAKNRIGDQSKHSRFLKRLNTLQNKLKISLEKVKVECVSQEQPSYVRKIQQ